MATKGGISGTGLAALGVGSILLWSAVKGRKWSEVLRELMSGEAPGTGTDYPIDVPAATVAEGTGNGSNGASGTGWESARASSYWGAVTASGKTMTARTIASPYLPLGTEVEIRYKGKTAVGTVWDFGPADWVMAADPTRFLDIAEPMMAELTGKKANLISVDYRITRYGTGRIYRPGAAMTEKLRQRWK